MIALAIKTALFVSHLNHHLFVSDNCRGLVMLIHGLAEHLGCYDELGCRLAAENFLAFGHDHRKLLLLLFFFHFP